MEKYILSADLLLYVCDVMGQHQEYLLNVIFEKLFPFDEILPLHMSN